MKVIIALFATILAVNSLTIHEEWFSFKSKHAKKYGNIVEEKRRFEIFQNNLKNITEHNKKYDAGLSRYKMGITRFADLNPEEFDAFLRKQNGKKPVLKAKKRAPLSKAPESVDWRKEGAVTDVKDQGQCGSCWAFSVTGVVEAQNFIKNGKDTPLSEQQLIDCDTNNKGCNGGRMTTAYDYVKSKGLLSEEDYPYKDKEGKCQDDNGEPAAKITGFEEVGKDEDSLEEAVGNVGPISVAIFAKPLQLYEEGIFDDECSNSPVMMNHGVLTVGYGSEDGQEYWIVKNSWGSIWGEEGYFRLAKNSDNLCGIANDASYPIML